jgi:hypothetical protein
VVVEWCGCGIGAGTAQAVVHFQTTEGCSGGHTHRQSLDPEKFAVVASDAGCFAKCLPPARDGGSADAAGGCPADGGCSDA